MNDGLSAVPHSAPPLTAEAPFDGARAAGATPRVPVGTPIAVAAVTRARGPLPQVRSLATWLLVVRPHALLFAVAPVVVALSALAADGADVRWARGLATVLAVGLAQAGCSAIDAYFDQERRVRALRAGDAAVAATSSPLMAHGIYPLEALRAGCIFFALAGIASIPLVLAGGAPVLALGIAGGSAGVFYSAGPHAAKLHPVGDMLLFLAFGPALVTFTAFSQRQPVSPLLLVLGMVLGLYMLASVFAAHLRDTTRLRALGRQTLATLLSERQVRLVCVGFVAVAYFAVLAMSLPLGAPHLMLLALLSLPTAVVPVSGVLRAAEGAPRALVVRQFGRAYALFVLWLVIGLALTGLWINLP